MARSESCSRPLDYDTGVFACHIIRRGADVTG
jgi:hypothetical protein